MKAALALLLSAVPSFGAAPSLTLSPGPAALVPFSAAAAAPLSLGTPLLMPALQPAALSLSAPAISPAPVVAAAPVAVSVVRALPALSALTVLPAASVGDRWDGSTPREEHEDAYAYVEHQKREAEAVQHARAEIPVVDYRRGAYSEHGAREFMESVLTLDDERTVTGKELLSYLVTPQALPPDAVPDPERVDFSSLGRNSAQIREIVAAKGVPYHAYERVLTQAFREGLIYRLTDARNGATYHGVPPHVRAAFGLEPEKPAPVAAKAAAPAAPTPFAVALAKLAAEAESLPHREELFEFTAQAVDAAVKAGELRPDAVSASFKDRAAGIDYDVPGLKDAVLTLSESAEGTPWEGRTADLLALFEKL